jgi:alpha-methylacyl-CoA racemase
VGPLAGLTIIEMAGIGPGPFAAMMLADHGAEVIRVERPGSSHAPNDPLLRSRRSVVLDLKDKEDRMRLRALASEADGLIEGFRPGVMERLGLGPDVLLADSPRLVYGRMTGWGQDGPLAQAAGHDINFTALAGTLAALGRAGEKPTAPINLVGMVAAMLGVKTGKPGQVVDCAMVDGAALLMSMMWGFRAAGHWSDERGTNLLDTGAPFYDTYETADGKFVAIGAIEPQFFSALERGLEVGDLARPSGLFDQAGWPEQKSRIAAAIRQRTRAEWVERFDTLDACFTPVLGFDEALAHPHNRARNTFVEVGGVVQPAPAPRYSRTPCAKPAAPVEPGSDQLLVAPRSSMAHPT